MSSQNVSVGRIYIFSDKRTDVCLFKSIIVFLHVIFKTSIIINIVQTSSLFQRNLLILNFIPRKDQV